MLALLLFGTLAQAADVPKLSRHVTDLTGTLSAQQVDQLDARLVDLQKRKGAQVVVLMVASTGDEAMDDYSLAVAEKNKVGRKGIDDGVLMLIAKNDHHVRIEVGYGLEGAIPDAATARIIREYLAPKFRTGDYAGGIGDALDALIGLINGEPLPAPVQGAPQEHGGFNFNTLIAGFFIVIFLRQILRFLPKLVRIPLGAVIGGIAGLIFGSLIFGLIAAVAGGALMAFGSMDKIGRAHV